MVNIDDEWIGKYTNLISKFYFNIFGGALTYQLLLNQNDNNNLYVIINNIIQTTYLPTELQQYNQHYYLQLHQ